MTGRVTDGRERELSAFVRRRRAPRKLPAWLACERCGTPTRRVVRLAFPLRDVLASGFRRVVVPLHGQCDPRSGAFASGNHVRATLRSGTGRWAPGVEVGHLRPRDLLAEARGLLAVAAAAAAEEAKATRRREK